MDVRGIRKVRKCCGELGLRDVDIVHAPEALGSTGDACGQPMWSIEGGKAH